MTLRDVINTPADVKRAKADEDRRLYEMVVATSESMTHPRALTTVAEALGIERRDVISAYWRHHRRLEAEGKTRRRRRLAR